MMCRLIQRLHRSEDGTATIELAVVVTVLATMLIGVVDITTAFNRKMELEQALQRSLEKIMNTTTFTTPTQTIKEEVALAVRGIEEEEISVDYLLECDNVIQEQSGSPEPTAPANTSEAAVPEAEEPDASAGCDPSEVQRRYITATVTDQFEPFFPLHKLGIAGSAFTISARAGMRVE
jgi:Flp pilus assembly pilin Flp